MFPVGGFARWRISDYNATATETPAHTNWRIVQRRAPGNQRQPGRIGSRLGCSDEPDQRHREREAGHHGRYNDASRALLRHFATVLAIFPERVRLGDCRPNWNREESAPRKRGLNAGHFGCGSPSVNWWNGSRGTPKAAFIPRMYVLRGEMHRRFFFALAVSSIARCRICAPYSEAVTRAEIVFAIP
jgi:hypothetical protein